MKKLRTSRLQPHDLAARLWLATKKLKAISYLLEHRNADLPAEEEALNGLAEIVLEEALELDAIRELLESSAVHDRENDGRSDK